VRYDIAGNAAAVQRFGLTLKLASNVLLGQSAYSACRWIRSSRRAKGKGMTAAVIDGQS
jgi:hypothetical protein